MFPDRELTRLATHKADLQRQITRRRAECVVAVEQAARPVVWLDGVVAFRRKLSPWLSLLMIPLAVGAGRVVAPRRTAVAALLRWAPLVLGAVRGLRTLASRKPVV